jgi:hypothetical protein
MVISLVAVYLNGQPAAEPGTHWRSVGNRAENSEDGDSDGDDDVGTTSDDEPDYAD